MPDRVNALFFELFNEVGIIEQLSRAMFEARLPRGMLVSHFAVLNHLIRVKDGRTPLELARAFQVAKTTMTHTLSVLERHELIDMQPNPADKRSKLIFISGAGRAFRERAITSLQPDIRQLSQRYDPAKVEHVLPLLTELRRLLDDQRSAAPR